MTELAATSPQRAWWRRTWLVLREPRQVFDALRDESDEDTSARAEPVLAIVILAGAALALSSSSAAHLYDDPAFDSGALIAVWAFLAGGVTGVSLYWIGGLLLHFGVLALGSHAPFQRTRQLLGFACVPLAASLVLWLPRLVLYGGDWFRFGGSDAGTPAAVFGWVEAAVGVWSVALLLVGVRAVERWTWGRSSAAVAVAAFVPALVALASAGLL